MYLVYGINFLLAISTTIGMTMVPFLVTDSLGLSLMVLGLMEGTTEFLSNLFRLVNGVLFDKIKNKRAIFVCSTGMAFASKALLLIPNPWTVLFSKTLERISNGTFASPRDAYVAEKAVNKGIALGILSVTKTAGCVLGPLVVSISTIFLGSLNENLNFFVVLCCILVFPTIIFSGFLNVSGVETSKFSLQEFNVIFKKLTPILLIVFLFFLGRFNDGLLMIHLKQKGFPEWFYLSTIAIFNFIMLMTSPVIGSQIDRGGIKKMLYLTIVSLGIFDVCFYQIGNAGWIYAGIGLVAWGIQRTGAQIVFASLVFKSVPKANYGTAIGIYYIVSGTGNMLAAFVAGYIAKNHFSSIFVLSGCFSLLALGLATFVFANKTSAEMSENYKLKHQPV